MLDWIDDRYLTSFFLRHGLTACPSPAAGQANLLSCFLIPDS